MRNLDVHQQVHVFHFNGVVIQIMIVPMRLMRQIVIAIQLAILGCLAAEMENAFTKHGHGKLINVLKYIKVTKLIFNYSDGEADCADKSDEANCNTTTTETTSSKKTPINFDSNNCQDWMFKCANSKCVPYW